jgi:hypothetical protein
MKIILRVDPTILVPPEVLRSLLERSTLMGLIMIASALWVITASVTAVALTPTQRCFFSPRGSSLSKPLNDEDQTDA